MSNSDLAGRLIIPAMWPSLLWGPGGHWQLDPIHVSWRYPAMREARRNEHRHDVFHFLLVASGNGSFMIGGQKMAVQAPQLCLVPPQLPHVFSTLPNEALVYHEFTFALRGSDAPLSWAALIEAKWPELRCIIPFAIATNHEIAARAGNLILGIADILAGRAPALLLEVYLSMLPAIAVEALAVSASISQAPVGVADLRFKNASNHLSAKIAPATNPVTNLATNPSANPATNLATNPSANPASNPATKRLGSQLADKTLPLNNTTVQPPGRHTQSDSQSRRLVGEDPLADVAAYLELHATDQLSLTVLADIAGMSEKHLCRAFKKRFGVPVFHAKRQHAMRSAERLLISTRYPLKQIAQMTGFSDQYHFSKAFRAVHGQPPGCYRAAIGGPGRLAPEGGIPDNQLAPDGAISDNQLAPDGAIPYP